MRARYDSERDPFTSTGSPGLPNGLNLGVQLYRLKEMHRELFAGDCQILLWPQYWAWLLCGVQASEVTSLGCHSDLWQPEAGAPSQLAQRHGWARRLPTLRRASDPLGTISPEWARRTGLSRDVRVYCGVHDSNAALIAARGFTELYRREATVLSTGTWFVAMRTPSVGLKVDLSHLDPSRDCLMNVDAEGRLIPSSRFMGGREIEMLTGIDSRRIDIVPDQPALLEAVEHVIAREAMILPTMTPGVGPFPTSRGGWRNEPQSFESAAVRAGAGLYAALVANEALDLIGARERILVEGRFAEAQVFIRALARLRPRDTVYACNAHNDVSFGALRLIEPELEPVGRLEPVVPLDVDLSAYQSVWRREARPLREDAP